MMGDLIEIYLSYADKDEKLRDDLLTQLAGLKAGGSATFWHRGMLVAGDDGPQEIKRHLTNAGIILLLISANYLQDQLEELKQAKQRKNAGIRVIPVLLSNTDWKQELYGIGGLLPLPTDGSFITAASSRAEALAEIAKDLRKVVEKMLQEIQQAAANTLQPTEDRDAQNNGELDGVEFLRGILARLDYKDQGLLFKQFVKEMPRTGKPVGAFVIHGKPSYGQAWLVNRLLTQLPKISVDNPIIVGLDPGGTKQSVLKIWRELVKKVGVNTVLVRYPLDPALRADIVNRYYERWQRESVVIILHNLYGHTEQAIDEFLRDFWQPLVELITKDTTTQQHYCLLFLLDNGPCVDAWNVPFAEQIDATWQPKVPLKFKQLALFKEDVLQSWIEAEEWDLRWPDGLTTQEILDESSSDDGTEKGIPELALDYICYRVNQSELSVLYKYQI